MALTLNLIHRFMTEADKPDAPDVNKELAAELGKIEFGAPEGFDPEMPLGDLSEILGGGEPGEPQDEDDGDLLGGSDEGGAENAG